MSAHVKSIHDETKSWCGENLGNEFHFKNVDHAVLNGLHTSQIRTCTECANLIIESIMKGRDKSEVKNDE